AAPNQVAPMPRRAERDLEHDGSSFALGGDGLLVSGCSPHLESVPSGGQAPAIRAKADAGNRAVLLECEGFLARGRVPNLHRPVVGSAGQALAIRAEADAPDYLGVPLEGEEFLTSDRVPHLDRPGIATAG